MAIIHRAALSPSKPELYSAWVPRQPWWPDREGPDIELAADYRLDDPEGEVGVQVHLLRTESGQVLQMPVTYRGAPLDGADEHLIGTTLHSVLGRRWVYDGCADPVCVRVMAAAAMTGGAQAVLEVQTPEGPQEREPSMTVKGTGVLGAEVPSVTSFQYDNGPLSAVIDAGWFGLEVVRMPGSRGRPPAGDYLLKGMWAGWKAPVTLAGVAV